MFEVRAKLSQSEFASIETLIFESEGMENWNLYENFDDKGYWVQGVFETEREAAAGKDRLISEIDFEVEFSIMELADADWKDSYRDHFHPWSIGGLHWVPLWLKGEYSLPDGDEVVWLDPGMAFGTGNHATTRLCVEQLIAYRGSAADAKVARVVDAGCGSGILAISAVKLGFERACGFDIDEDAIRIADENAAVNGVEGDRFRNSGLDEGLEGGRIDCLIANILANVLVDNSRLLVDAVAPRGWLILSGILSKEADDVAAHFANASVWNSIQTDKLEEWASVRLVKAD